MTHTDAPLVLFDLDDTLSDRAAGYSAWAARWLERHDLDPGAAMSWMVEHDDGGYTDRLTLFRDAASHFGLSDDPAAMADDYRRTSHELYQRDPVVIAELESLRRIGWRVGIVTNGGPGQDEKIDRIGLRPLLTCCVVSDVVGVRKPDPRIFAIAIEQAGGADLSTTWMVGDHPTNDIVGAHQAGIATLWIAHGRDWPAELDPPDVTVAGLAEAFAHLRSLIAAMNQRASERAEPTTDR